MKTLPVSLGQALNIESTEHKKTTLLKKRKLSPEKNMSYNMPFSKEID